MRKHHPAESDLVRQEMAISFWIAVSGLVEIGLTAVLVLKLLLL
jgi:hypothetical protein